MKMAKQISFKQNSASTNLHAYEYICMQVLLITNVWKLMLHKSDKY